ncbi:TonB C-terminal domain-containing protein [Moraxella sp. ZJ142]|uniref:TonB C-terminal domain-containing protein n=1 Tax=Moraxella marmotae TaxID=3344520 RepID=UPI0035D4B572
MPNSANISDSTHKPNFTLPIVASVVIHAVIISIVAASVIAPPNDDTGLAATLVNQSELSAAKNTLKAHHDAQRQAQHRPKSAISPADQALLNARTHHYQPPPSRQTAPQAVPSFEPVDMTAKVNDNFTNGGIGSLADSSFGNDTITNDDNRHSLGAATADNGNAATSSAPSQAQINAALSAVKNRIETIWKKYPVQPNQAISFQVNIDAQGNVVSIVYGAGHADLKESIEAAVRAAAPFSELAGLKNSIKLKFVTEQISHADSSNP